MARPSTRGEAAGLVGADTAIVLGSGLGSLCEEYPAEVTCDFTAVPGLGAAGVAGHRGEFRLSSVASTKCLFVSGRRHIYEGDAQTVERLIGFIAACGVRELILTSAAGGTSAAFSPGTFVLADDVVDLQNRPGRARPHDPDGSTGGGGRVPAVNATTVLQERPVGLQMALDADLGGRLSAAARAAHIPLARGTIACVSGPLYETATEVIMLQRLGASVATMSCGPEVAAAKRAGLRVAAVAFVTNSGTGIAAGELAHAEVLAYGRRRAGDFRRLVEAFLAGGKR